MRSKISVANWVSVVAIILATISAALPVRATWQQLPTPNLNRAIRACFFFNEQVGFIAATGDVGIYKTTDAGQSWTQCNTPKGYAGNYTSIFMVDTLNGWATIEDLLTSKRIFRTVDGGLNWTAVGPQGSASCTYQTPAALVVTSRDLNSGSGLVSQDGGRSFVSGVLKVTNGVDFCDNTHGVVTGFMATPWMRSLDGGVNWQVISPQITDECWGVYGVKGTPIFYTAAERDPNTYKTGGSSVRRSADFGATWQVQTLLPIRTTGVVAGVGETIYVQADTERSFNGALRGLYRSTDRGVTWVSVGGPSDDRDTRFAVLGCMGGVVYAFDAFGHVWKTRDGGDGALAEPPVTTTFTPSPLTLTSPICGSDQASILLKNLYCRNIELQSIGFADSTIGVITSGGLRFGHLPTLPSMFGQDEGDSITILWDPASAYHHDTTITAHVHVRYFSDGLGREVDTILTINAHAAGTAPQFAMSPPRFQLDTLHPCAPIDTVIKITNSGCDTLFITGATLLTSSGVTLLDSSGQPIKFPYALPPTASLRLKLHIGPGAAGPFSSTTQLHFVHQGVAKDSSFTVTAFVPFERAFTFPKEITVDSISNCRTYDTVLTITNPGCDTLWINTVALLVGNNYQLRALPGLPNFILPDSSIKFILRFAPSTTGVLRDSLIIALRALEVPVRLSVAITGVATGGLSAYKSSIEPPVIDFGTKTRCAPPDSVVFTIVNPGCRTMTVRSIALEGTVAPAITMEVAPQVPRNLLDGDTIRIVVRMQPNAVGSYSGQVHVRYQFVNGAIIDSLYPVTLSVIHGPKILAIDTSLRTFQPITFCSTKDTTIILRNAGCDSLIIDQRDLIGNSFIMLNPRSVPFGLAANETDTIRIRFVPMQAGLVLGRLSIGSNADTNPDPGITFVATAIPTDTLTFRALAHANYRVGDVVSIDLKSDRSVKNRGLRSIHWVLAYDGDVLTYLDKSTTIPQSTLSVGSELRSAFKTAYLPVTLQAANSELDFDSSTPLATLRFTSTISDSSSTGITFSAIDLNGGDATYQKCDLGSASLVSTLELSLICGDSTIENFFRYGSKLPLTADPVYPNPMFVSQGTPIILPYHSTEKGAVQLLVLDPTGQKRFEAANSAPDVGGSMFEIPTDELTAGTYFFRLLQPSSGRSVTGKFVVLR